MNLTHRQRPNGERVRDHLHYVLHILRNCAFSPPARELCEGWQWVSFLKPPTWLRLIATSVSLLAELGVLFAAYTSLIGTWEWAVVPSEPASKPLFWGIVIMLGWGAWGIVYWTALAVGWAVANCYLAIAQLLAFPVCFAWDVVGRCVVGWRLLQRLRSVLIGWLPPIVVVQIFDNLMLADLSTVSAETWLQGQPTCVLNRLMETRSNLLLYYLPVSIWPELIPSLTPGALATLLRKSLRTEGAARPVLAALVKGERFQGQTTNQLLAMELAQLSPKALANTLDTVASFEGEAATRALVAIFTAVQKQRCDQATLYRFLEALVLVDAKVCEAVACKA